MVANIEKAGILDTSIATENTGDLIIMESARQVLESLLDAQTFYFPTHEKLGATSYRIQQQLAYNVACGTNLLHAHMGLVKQWNVGLVDAFKLKPVVLLGVGWRSQASRKTDVYTRWLLRRLLDSRRYHSVRDSYSEARLREIGFDNVLNTGCPTCWSLTPDHCASIPQAPGESAVCLLTDYSRNEDRDAELLDLVCSRYANRFFWCQGSGDLNYIRSLGFDRYFRFIPPTLRAYHRLLSDPSLALDYVGNRLHGGIYALKHGRRATIIGVDHRANSMGKDINLPVIDRYRPFEEIKSMIMDERAIEISLPASNIEKWSNQFKEEVQPNGQS